jgi:thiol-disulfide isomerase/thioredoxin
MKPQGKLWGFCFSKGVFVRVYLKAILAALVVAVIFGGLFRVWRLRTQSNEGVRKLSTLDSMESQGVPGFEAKDLSGKPFSLEMLKGKTVIVNFWASWCGPCVEEVPSLLSLVKAMGGKLHLVAVSGDSSKEDIEAFLKAFPEMKGPDVTIIWDEDHSISKQYGVDRLPESFLAGKNLKLAKKIVGGITWHTKESEAYILDLFNKQ